MRLPLAAALTAGAVLLPCGATMARTLRLPEGKPAVMFDVPDDWTVTPADGGLQLVSPDRSSIVLAGMARSDKAGLAAWQRAAGQRMVDFGIAFDAKANAPKADAPRADAAKLPGAGPENGAVATLSNPGAQPKMKADELAPLSSVPSMALLGRASDVSVADIEANDAAGRGAGQGPDAGTGPRIGPGTGPGAGKVEGAGTARAAAPATAAPVAAKSDAEKPDAGTSEADKGGKPLHFASVVIRAATLAGKPVDVQFLNFGYSRSEWFLMQQESGPDDGRAGAIVRSVRAIR